MNIEKSSRIIGEFMGGEFVSGEGSCEDRIYFKHNWYYMPLNYHKDWNSLMEVGVKMEELVIEGNWGKFEQFFSDELHTLGNFKLACSEFNIDEAHKYALAFINSIPQQNPEIVKKAKEYEGD